MNKPNYIAIAKSDFSIKDYTFSQGVNYHFYIEDLSTKYFKSWMIGESEYFLINKDLFDIKPIEDRALTFKEIEALTNEKLSIPNDKEIAETKAILEHKLDHKPINRLDNLGVKEGYLEAINVLDSKIKDYNKTNINDLKTDQGRAIVMLAIDYLKGECSQKMLCNVPIKDR